MEKVFFFVQSRRKEREIYERQGKYVKTLTFGQPDKILSCRDIPANRPSSAGRRRDCRGMDHLEYVFGTLGVPYDKAPSSTDEFFVSFIMNPTFEEKVLRHENGHYIVRDWMGAITEISDEFDSPTSARPSTLSPAWHKFPVENPRGLGKMRLRYDAEDSARLPANLAEIGKSSTTAPSPITVSVNGPSGSCGNGWAWKICASPFWTPPVSSPT